MTYENNLQAYADRYFKRNWQIPYFYRYLQVSPTYRMAYLHIAEQAAKPDIWDVDRMIYIAQCFGDVWNLDFMSWFQKHGTRWLVLPINPTPRKIANLKNMNLISFQHMDLPHIRAVNAVNDEMAKFISGDYAVDGSPDSVIISVPVEGNKKKVLSMATTLIKQELNKIPDSKGLTKPRISFLSNKLQRETFDKHLYAIYYRSKNGARHTDVSAEVNKKFGTKRFNKEVAEKNGRLPENIISQSSDLFAEALFITEWASVGRFPAKERRERLKIQTYENVMAKDKYYKLQFDWKFIKSQIENGNISTELPSH